MKEAWYPAKVPLELEERRRGIMYTMDIKGLQFLSRFSLPPNSLGYCGKYSAPEKFKKCVIEGKCQGVKGELKEFIVLHPYLKTLSKAVKQPLFSHKVAEAYWFGNNELKKVKKSDYRVLLKNFKKQGVPDWLIEDLSKNEPKRFIPTHLFQVLHVGVGRVSKSVPYNIETINNCMIRWGKVQKINGDEVVANLNSLKKVGKRYGLILRKEKLPVVPNFIPGLKVGDFVIAHWMQVIQKLNKREIEKLSFWTKETLKVINQK